MKEIALYDAKNTLSALIAEVEATGEEVVITRHGKPVAKLGPVKPRLTQAERRELGAYLLARMDELAKQHPETATPISWEALKADMYPDD